MLFEEGPRRNNNEEGQGGATEANLKGQGNILKGPADEKRDDLLDTIQISTLCSITYSV
jgi:hypothetical protein